MKTARALLPILLVLVATPAPAGPTRVLVDDSAAAFLAGRPDGVVVGHAGLLRPGARLLALPTSEAGIWSLAFGGDGVLYAGTGNEGRILGIRGDDVSVVHETGSVLVAALVRGPDGEIYAGTVPDGRVYRIEQMASGLRVGLLAQLPDPNVWALDVDELGRVFAGTGPNGRVYRIAPDGQAQVLLETGDRDVLAVLVDGKGGLFVGTGGKGLLLHLTPTRAGDAVRVLHDFEEQEVRALARVGDALYAAVNRDLAAGQAQVARDLVQQAAAEAARASRAEPVPADEEVGAEPGQGEGAPKALLRGALYAVSLEGGAESLLSFPDNGLAALAADAAGGLILACGRGGRVYRHTPAEGAALLHVLDADQAVALAVKDGRLAAVGAANAGSVHLVVEGGDEPATYRSRVMDDEFVSRWGVLAVETQVKGLVVETRSGNTAEPDATWSEWKTLRAPDPDRGEPAAGSLRIASPPARFLQYRLRWPAGATGAVRRVTLAYLPRNQRPQISPVTVDGAAPAKAESQEKKEESPTPEGPVRKVIWKVDAVDGDPLRTELAYRAVGEETWKPLPVSEKTLQDTTYTWDTTSVPDGIYVVRVTVSDAPGNAEGALEATAVSEPFLVDNRRPEVELSSYEAEKAGGELRGVARDGFSRIARLEFAVDGGPWQPLASTDALLDEPVEAFVVRVPADLSAGTHSVAVRATDAAGNVGVASTTIRIR